MLTAITSCREGAPEGVVTLTATGDTRQWTLEKHNGGLAAIQHRFHFEKIVDRGPEDRS